jgi:hypothetical protein
LTTKAAKIPGQNSQSGMMSLHQAGQLLMVSDHWVRDLSKKGYIPKPEKGMVPLVATVQGYIRWLKDEERRASKTAAASDLQRTRAREIELRIAREEGNLIEAEDAEAAFADILGQWRSELDGLSRAVTRNLAMRESIDTYIAGMVERVRARFAAERERLAKGKK